MARIYLKAGYKDKDVVKRAGAKYDADTKKWYIDDENDEQMANLLVFRRFLDINWYIEKRLGQIDMESEEAKGLLEWKKHLEEVKARIDKGEMAIPDFDTWYGWKPGD